MKLGEFRELRIPYKEAFGLEGYPQWGIPRGATVWYTVELLRIRTGRCCPPSMKMKEGSGRDEIWCCIQNAKFMGIFLLILAPVIGIFMYCIKWLTDTNIWYVYIF
jgi:hypothetical protein